MAEIKDIKADEVLDCVGIACPMPIYKTSNRLKGMKPGQVLEQDHRQRVRLLP